MHEELFLLRVKKKKKVVLKFKHVLILGNELEMSKRKSKTAFGTCSFSYMGAILRI